MLRAVATTLVSILMLIDLAGLSDILTMLIDDVDVIVEKRSQRATKACVRGSWWWSGVRRKRADQIQASTNLEAKDASTSIPSIAYVIPCDTTESHDMFLVFLSEDNHAADTSSVIARPTFYLDLEIFMRWPTTTPLVSHMILMEPTWLRS